MSASLSGVRTVLRYTGIPPLPSRNWLIFLSLTGSCAAAYVYDRRQCRAIRQEYIDKVKDLADEPVDKFYLTRRVTVYGGRWPGDEDYDQTLKYFRKYVKPILVAAAVDFTMVGGKRLGDIAKRVAEDVKVQRRLEAGIDTTPEILQAAPIERQQQLDGGIMIIGRPTFKEFMAGLKRGWTDSLDKAQELERDGRFDEPEDGDLPPPPPTSLPFTSTTLSTSHSLTIPSLPPIALVPFTDLVGFTRIPLMIWQWFNRRNDAYRLVMGQTRPFSAPQDDSEPLFSDITSTSTTPTDLDFDVACERLAQKETDKAREKYYVELKTQLETARALARGTREPTKEEVRNPPPTEVELRA
ncbi:mitochondrial import inner membrane translocase subunit TIM54 [Mycena amicta]|nr:mitochondrial import inner membrane translocase subunit TIM54 [Mycena amicta]